MGPRGPLGCKRSRVLCGCEEGLRGRQHLAHARALGRSRGRLLRWRGGEHAADRHFVEPPVADGVDARGCDGAAHAREVRQGAVPLLQLGCAVGARLENAVHLDTHVCMPWERGRVTPCVCVCDCVCDCVCVYVCV